MSTMKSPKAGELPPDVLVPLPKIRIKAPEAPRRIPPAFLTVIGSRRKIQANSITHIGMVVVTSEASPGDVRLTPIIKQP